MEQQYAELTTVSAATTTAVEIPQWMINVHECRKRLFLKIVEPIIVFILGPVVDEEDIIINTNHVDHYYQNHHLYSPSSSYSEYNNQTNHGRRLGFLPNYVEDVSTFRESSMSFATLTMLFTIMTCVMIVFLSCFYHNQKTSPLFISPRRHRLPRLVPPPLPVDGTFSWVST